VSLQYERSCSRSTCRSAPLRRRTQFEITGVRLGRLSSGGFPARPLDPSSGRGGAWAMPLRPHRLPAVSLLLIRDLVEQFFQRLDRGLVFVAQRRSSANALTARSARRRSGRAAAIARDIRQHVRLDLRLARLAEVDVTRPYWPPPGLKNDVQGYRLNDVAGQGSLKPDETAPWRNWLSTMLAWNRAAGSASA